MKSKLEIPIVNARPGADWLQAGTVNVKQQRLAAWSYSQSNHNMNVFEFNKGEHYGRSKEQ